MINKVIYLFNGHNIDEKSFYSRFITNILNYNKHLNPSQMHFKIIYYLERLDKNNIVTIPITFVNLNGIVTETLYENQYERIITKK